MKTQLRIKTILPLVGVVIAGITLTTTSVANILPIPVENGSFESPDDGAHLSKICLAIVGLDFGAEIVPLYQQHHISPFPP